MRRRAEIHWPKPSCIHTVVFDFDGVFTDNKVYVSESGKEWVRCDRADGLALDWVRHYQKEKKLQTHFFILSTERNPVVRARAKKLQLDCVFATGNKLKYLQKYFADRYPSDPDPFKGLVYLGNDLNDLPAMAQAGFAVAPNDAHKLVKQTADVVLPQNGGDGFVRAFIEAFLAIEDLPIGEVHELVSNR
jgi:3-deoxy-D-manno-octulosonate 8-phosphate phosphatase (KDO 8-P phosphatase)